VNLEDKALVDRFLDMMAAEAGASRNTLAAYRTDLERTSESLGGVLGSADSDALSGLGKKWSDLAPSTVARRSAALRRFYGFLFDEGIRKDDPSAALPRPAFERPLPKILDSDEVSAMFQAAEDRASSGEHLALRNLALSPRCSRRSRIARRAASISLFATSRFWNCSTAPAFGPPSWSAFRAVRCASASHS